MVCEAAINIVPAAKRKMITWRPCEACAVNVETISSLEYIPARKGNTFMAANEIASPAPASGTCHFEFH